MAGLTNGFAWIRSLNPFSLAAAWSTVIEYDGQGVFPSVAPVSAVDFGRGLVAMVALGLASTLSNPASAASLHGTWCGAAEILYFDAHGVGANEHTICAATPPPPKAAGRYSADLACRNVYPGERLSDGNYAVTEVPLDRPTSLVAIRLPDDRLAVLFDEDPTGLLLERCD